MAKFEFRDVCTSREHRFSLGVEAISGRFYLSLPVANGLVDYEEYYELDQDTFEQFRANPDIAVPFAERARKRELDHLLLIKPGSDRGTAV